MKKILLFVVAIVLFSGCRKDNSVLLNAKTNSSKCLITKSMSTDGRQISELKYQDSIVTEVINKENGTITSADYLVIETPKKFVTYEGSKTPQDAKTRIYLNDFGSISKEVALELNSNGTLSEDLSKQNIFTYNSKKLLTKIESTLVDEGVYDITYDSQNRLEKIVISDGNGEIFFVYDNITHDSQKKTDNFISIELFDSLSAFFMPSLNSTYIKTYTLSSPGIPTFNTVSQSEFKFTNGNLSEVKNKLIFYGQEINTTVKMTLNCK